MSTFRALCEGNLFTSLIPISFGLIALCPIVSEFDEYFLSLRLNHHKINPWFREYWESMFDCTLTGGSNKTLCLGLYLQIVKDILHNVGPGFYNVQNTWQLSSV